MVSGYISEFKDIQNHTTCQEISILVNMAIVKPIINLPFSVWEQMWLDYAGVRVSELNSEINRTTYAKLIDPSSSLQGIAMFTEEPVGFAQFYYHPSTWSLSEVCYLQDLYVRPDSRGQGIGKSLIQAVAEIARDRGCSELNWQTRVSNTVAQSLYSKIAEQIDLIPYRMEL